MGLLLTNSNPICYASTIKKGVWRIGGKSISHCQGKGSLRHNNREFTAQNIDPERSKYNVVFVKKEIEDAYNDCFGPAVERYNARQNRNDRKITDGYYQHLFGRKPCGTVLTSANKQKSFYEDLVQIGTKDDTGVGTADGKTAAECLTKYMEGFQQRNPNFHVFNATLHMDEATPHLHIDYVPIGHYKRGLDTQNGLAQALKEMGYGSGKDAVSRWREAERNVLERICEQHGIKLDEPKKSRGYSFSVDEYKTIQERKKSLEQEISKLKKKITVLTEKELKQIDCTPKLGGGFKELSPKQAQALVNTEVEQAATIKQLKNQLKTTQTACEKALGRADEAEKALRMELSPSSSKNLKRAAEWAERENQLRTLKKILGLPENATYNEIQQKFKNVLTKNIKLER